MRKKSQVTIGERFGRGVVLGVNEEISKRCKKTYVDMVCDCGTKYFTTYGALKEGISKSCGCLRRELTGQRFKGTNEPTIYVTHNGETHSLIEWSQITGINLRTLYTRYSTFGYRGDKLFCTTSHSTGKDLRLKKQATTNQ